LRVIRLGAAIFLLAVLVRGAYLYDSRDNPTFDVPVVDSMTYDQLARGMVEGGGITEELFWQPLFYPLFLVVVYGLSNCSIVSAKLAQMVLGGVTCVLVYRLGEKLFGRLAGILAGVITAIYMPLVFCEGELLATGWAAFWSVTLVLCLLKAAEKPTMWRCFGLGLCGVLSIITRPEFLPFFIAGCVWLAVVLIRRRIEVTKLLAGVAGIVGGFALVAAPIGILSYRELGKVRILPYSGGVNFYIGNNPNYEETIAARPGLEWTRLVELPLKEGIRDRYGQERFFAKKTIDYIKSDPLSFLRGLEHKAVQFASSREIPRNTDIYLFRKWSGLLRVGVWKFGGFGFPFGLLLPLAAVGGVYRRRKTPAPVWLFIVLYPASVILVFAASRYRMPVIPIVAVLAAAGSGVLREIVKGRRWAKLGMAGAIFVAVGAASSVAGPFYEERRINYEAELYYVLGGSLEKQHRTQGAIEAYSKAISLKTDYAEAHHNLGLLLMKQQRVGEALEHLNTALTLEPASSDLHRDLGMALFKEGKIAEAVGRYYRAIQINPLNGGAHNYLGLALQAQGDLDKAVKHYSLAVRIRPEDADIHYNFGLALQLQGKLDEAVRQYGEAIRLKPDFINAHSNLGVILAGQGKLDEAIVQFTEALKIKPDSAELHCNLGIALESEGRLDEAISAYRKALAIDPKHEWARKALEKLVK